MNRRLTAVILLVLAAVLLHGRFVVPHVMQNEAKEAERRRLQAERDADGTIEDVRADLSEQLRDLIAEWRVENPRVRIRDVPDEAVENRLKRRPRLLEDSGPDWNPPGEDFLGSVKSVNAVDGLATIDLGSDSGLTRGKTLVVFRLRPAPRVVGIIRVVEIRPKEAVARIVHDVDMVRVGDEVSGAAFFSADPALASPGKEK